MRIAIVVDKILLHDGILLLLRGIFVLHGDDFKMYGCNFELYGDIGRRWRRYGVLYAGISGNVVDNYKLPTRFGKMLSTKWYCVAAMGNCFVAGRYCVPVRENDFTAKEHCL